MGKAIYVWEQGIYKKSLDPPFIFVVNLKQPLKNSVWVFFKKKKVSTGPK